MGVIYIVLPLDDKLVDYLRTLDVPIPNRSSLSRNPTPREIREVCRSLTDCNVQPIEPSVRNWEVLLEPRSNRTDDLWAHLTITDFNGDESQPHSISFSKGSPSLMIRIVRELSSDCGPLVIIPDTGCDPLIVKTDDDIDHLFATWEHTCGDHG